MCEGRKKHYYNNGIKEIQSYECPEGFVKGRLPEVIRRCADGHRGRKASDETKHLISESMKGKNKGKSRSKENKRKISESLKNKGNTGKHSYINSSGEQRYFFDWEIIPEGFIKKGLPKSYETIRKIKESESGKHISEETRKRISESKTGVKHPHSEQTKKKISATHKSIETKNKMYQTKHKNNSFNTSKFELNFRDKLTEIFDVDDIFSNYIDEFRYPFRCDFYIKSLDIFIELNIHWTHGGHLFNPENEIDINKLNIWIDKSVNSQFFKNAIEVWTKRDVIKRTFANNNNLNYYVAYNEKDIDEIINILKNIKKLPK